MTCTLAQRWCLWPEYVFFCVVATRMLVVSTSRKPGALPASGRAPRASGTRLTQRLTVTLSMPVSASRARTVRFRRSFIRLKATITSTLCLKGRPRPFNSWARTAAVRVTSVA